MSGSPIRDQQNRDAFAVMRFCLIAAAIALLIILAGCATPGPAPIQIQTITKTVEVPVPVPCFTEADRPIAPTPTPIDIEYATVDQMAAAIAADDIADALYAAAVDRLFLQCQKAGGIK